jgi:hypothetical protein
VSVGSCKNRVNGQVSCLLARCLGAVGVNFSPLLLSTQNAVYFLCESPNILFIRHVENIFFLHNEALFFIRHVENIFSSYVLVAYFIYIYSCYI